jgi:hypothetical protein
MENTEIKERSYEKKTSPMGSSGWRDRLQTLVD